LQTLSGCEARTEEAAMIQEREMKRRKSPSKTGTTAKRLPPGGYDDPRPADPVFARLCMDLTLAHDARRRIQNGQLERDCHADAERLERESLRHLANYLTAAAWAEANDA
jgi:hypothetical protein